MVFNGQCDTHRTVLAHGAAALMFAVWHQGILGYLYTLYERISVTLLICKSHYGSVSYIQTGSLSVFPARRPLHRVGCGGVMEALWGPEPPMAWPGAASVPPWGLQLGALISLPVGPQYWQLPLGPDLHTTATPAKTPLPRSRSVCDQNVNLVIYIRPANNYRVIERRGESAPFEKLLQYSDSIMEKYAVKVHGGEYLWAAGSGGGQVITLRWGSQPAPLPQPPNPPNPPPPTNSTSCYD